MLRFSFAKNSASDTWADMPREERYTRFAKHQESSASLWDSGKRAVIKPLAPTTRMPHRHTKETPESPRPLQIDENAHLYASNNISVSILEKALPMRFSRLNEA